MPDAAFEARDRERTEALQEAYRELTSFTYTVSHDLRSPVRIINGYATMLAEDYAGQLDEAEQARYEPLDGKPWDGPADGDADTGLSGGSAVLQSDDSVLEEDDSVLSDDELEGEAEPSRRVELAIEKDLVAHADPQLMQSLLQNLLQNAWKYSAGREGARVAFGAGREEGEIRYFVRDNGPGFDMEQAGRLFMPFQRLHGSEIEGIGIGLATAHSIVHKHGGRIWAEARPGEGATFYFTLPG